MKELRFHIVGTAPLLMNRFSTDPGETKGLSKKTPAEIAEISCYRNKDTNELILPALNLWRALVSGSKWSKGKGRSTLERIAAACLRIKDKEVSFGRQQYEVDARAVVNPMTHGRVLAYRPRLDAWELRFTVLYDSEYLSESDVRKIVADTGLRIGLCDFRVERKGFYGTFRIQD
jgi:hypothetical protein